MSGWLELEQAAGEIESLAVECERLRAAMLARIAQVDASEGWRYDGAANGVQWLVARLGISHATARSWVEVAGKLGELPGLAAAYAGGGVSFDQLRAVCRFATPDEDTELAGSLGSRPVSAIQREARRRERRPPRDLGGEPTERWLRWRWDHRDDVVRLQGALPSGDGALFIKTIERLAEGVPADPDSIGSSPIPERHAAGLVELCSQGLGADTDPDRATVVIHTDLAGPADVGVSAETDTDLMIGNRHLRRMACDARIEHVLERNGVAVGIGRASRRIPAWLARQLGYRDQGCRFPGCERTRWVHAHHMVHWIDGGPTDLDNLVTLCGYHHRLIHEHRWKITGDPNAELAWIRPDGTMFNPKLTRLQQMMLTMSATKLLQRG